MPPEFREGMEFTGPCGLHNMGARNPIRSFAEHRAVFTTDCRAISPAIVSGWLVFHDSLSPFL